MKEALEAFQEGARLDPSFKKAAHNVGVIKGGIEARDDVAQVAQEIEEEDFEERLDLKFRAS